MANKKVNVDASALFGNMTKEEIRESVVEKGGRPKNENLIRENTSQKGLTKDYIRSTFIVPVDDLETLKDYAYTERLTIKDVIGQAISEYIEKHVDKDKLLHRPDNWR